MHPDLPIDAKGRRTPRKPCFIVMPISTRAASAETYNDDQHFFHVLELLFVPAVVAAGYEPVIPTVAGSLVIHQEIIRQLCTAEMVLADMSSLNENVFFEMGIRTAINRPLAIVIDEKTKVPFDHAAISYFQYNSALAAWSLQEDIDKVSRHLLNTAQASQGRNGMWEAFDGASFLTVEGQERDRTKSYVADVEAIRGDLKFLKGVWKPARTSLKERIATSPLDMYAVLADVAQNAGHTVSLDRASHHRISLFHDRPLGKQIRKILQSTGRAHGYNVKFVGRGRY
jgi:hypothetical protein